MLFFLLNDGHRLRLDLVLLCLPLLPPLQHSLLALGQTRQLPIELLAHLGDGVLVHVQRRLDRVALVPAGRKLRLELLDVGLSDTELLRGGLLQPLGLGGLRAC